MKYLILPLVLLFFVGCGNTHDQNPQPTIEINLTLKDSFGQEADIFNEGEDIEFVYTVTNNGLDDFELTFGSTVQNEFRVSALLDIEIWQTGEFGGFVITEVVIPPGETLERSFVWNQELDSGDTLPIGEYTAYGSFYQYTFSERSQSFTIQ